MSPQNNWTTRDLFELASLDALGLLSEDERRAFEDAFAQAGPHVQSQLRDQQTRMAEIDSLLPRVEAPAGLKARVMAAVQAAIEAIPRRTAPVMHGAGRTPKLLPARGVNAVWRGLAIGAAAAAVVFGVVTLQVFRQNQEISSSLASSTMTDMLLKEFSPSFEKRLLSPTTRFVKFEAPQRGAGDGGLALLLLDEGSRSGQFFCKNLPQSDGNYTLVLVDGDGRVVGDAMVAFRYNGSGIARCDLNEVELSGGKSLALMAPGKAGAGPITLLRSNTQ
jgi:hypothetical protein